MNTDVSFLQGSATAALTWVLYDVCLTFDREISSVWRATWSLSKFLYVFSRYHTILALGFFLMEAIGTKHFTLPLSVILKGPLPPSFYAPCFANLKYSLGSRWYLGLTEVFSILAGELLILLRINALYGWSRAIIALTLFLFSAESVIGIVTTVLSLTGGSKHLMGSTGILTCHPNQVNIPDVNIAMWCTSMAVACIYLCLVIQKARDVMVVIESVDGQMTIQRMSFMVASKMTPTLYRCLRDAAIYFVVIFGVLLLNLVLILEHNLYAQLGTPWLLATYSVASTRIFLNLKDMTQPRELYNGAISWSEFERDTGLDFQMRSELRLSRSEQTAWSPEPHPEIRGVSRP